MTNGRWVVSRAPQRFCELRQDGLRPPAVPDPSRSRFLCATIQMTAILDVLHMPTSMALTYMAFVANAFGPGALHNVPPGHDDHSNQSPQLAWTAHALETPSSEQAAVGVEGGLSAEMCVEHV
jgi:hypothetical protein